MSQGRNQKRKALRFVSHCLVVLGNKQVTTQTFAASISAVGKRETVDYSDALQKFLEETTWKISILQR